ncbi:MAG: (deoxy)nucleoside triphosphate pyrophosphohydrolase [Sphaerochaetaceae bacterium]|nr:(deoxy)nucleoside triphosphate pyrophosphohydrolase [Sphaerochaetaceae bacterium]
MKTINVVAAVIINDDKIFTAQRPDKGEVAKMWEFPGGKIEQGELEEEALFREIQEEFDTDLNVGKKIITIQHQYSNFKVIMSGYFCTIREGNLDLKEHLDSKWLCIDNLSSVNWAPADRPIVKEVIKQLSK